MAKTTNTIVIKVGTAGLTAEDTIHQVRDKIREIYEKTIDRR